MTEPEQTPATAGAEIEKGERFGFGANWKDFLQTVDEERVEEAVKSLRALLQRDSLVGSRIADVGCGSGLFSLAARRLGGRVHSIDFDPDSVECTRILRSRYFPGDAESGEWIIEQGSALDAAYLDSLGTFDVVYSWGVLHHTGAMWEALERVETLVAQSPGATLAIAIYNDEGWKSRWWSRVKRLYCSGRVGRWLVKSVYYPWFMWLVVLASVVKRQNPAKHFSDYKKLRGMSVIHDWADWLGGYPFEVATPESIFKFYRERGFELVNLVTTNSLGCNQFVFQRK